MSKVYGYCRIFNPKQSMDKQKRSILAAFPEAELIEEDSASYADQGERFSELLEMVKPGETIVFDSVSRLNQDAHKGSEIYLELYHAGVDLVFLKQRQIDTAVYRKAITMQLEAVQAGTGTKDQRLKEKIDLLKEYTSALARDQIEVSFRQAEDYAANQRLRTKAGLQAAKTTGKQIGLPKGAVVITKKEREAVPMIRKLNQHFGGALNDQETAQSLGISRQTVAKYISRMLAQDLEDTSDRNQ